MQGTGAEPPDWGSEPHPRLVFDTNTLFRFQVRTLIDDLAGSGTIQAFWSAETETELRRALRARGRGDAEGFLRRWSSARVETGQELEPRLAAKLRDPKDRHVIEAALAVGARLIVTDNPRDFPLKVLRRLALDRQGADALFAARVEDLTSGHRPDDLLKAKLPKTAKALRMQAANRE